MGNQLFQYAALFGLADKNGYKMVIPITPNDIKGELKVTGHTKDGHPIEKYDYCLSYFSITAEMVDRHSLVDSKIYKQNSGLKKIYKKSHSQIISQYLEPHFHFDQEFFNIKDFTDIEGYFQSEKYFSHCSDKIRREFSIKKEYQDEAREKLSIYKKDSDVLISAHIRRLGHENPETQNIHKYPTADYYQNALNYFKIRYDNPKMLVFSDDMKWCKQNIVGNEIDYSEENSSIIDFTMMSLCNHNIITPSSFSWWASWLNNNPDKVVIAPSGKLFGPKGPEITSDYLPDYIIRI